MLIAKAMSKQPDFIGVTVIMFEYRLRSNVKMLAWSVALSTVAMTIGAIDLGVYAAGPAGSDKQKEETAKNISKVAGVSVTAKELEPPPPEQPIKGFHPIKKALAPIIQLQKNSVQLQQQIMKLEGPISALQPSMNGLHEKMDDVHASMGTMDGHLTTMNDGVRNVGGEMQAVRKDISEMRKDLSGLKPPLHSILKPLNNVASPLEEVRNELNDMRTLLASVLFAIVASTIGIAVGTPVVGYLVYANRRKLFPNLAPNAGALPGDKTVDGEKPDAEVKELKHVRDAKLARSEEEARKKAGPSEEAESRKEKEVARV